MLTLGSLFDGIGGWQLAAIRNGIKPLWSSEIDPYCCQITQRHFPDTVQLGDINSIDATNLPHVDIITAGSPCQDLSVAGKRSGLHASRSGLFFKATDIVRRIRPQFFAWENVTGAFSSNAGNDFRAVLEEILQEPVPLPRYWSNAGLVDGRHCQLCWRVLDAQYFGVPQRRRRIFLIADFAGRRAAKILFERKSLQGDFATGTSKKRLATARTRTTADSAIYSIHGNTIDRQLQNGGNGKGILANTSYTLNTVDRHAVAVFDNHWKDARLNPVGDVAKNIIRRLTPLECERLQGLPDNWTNSISDTQRYKALGNGMAQPCADWILQRIKENAS